MLFMVIERFRNGDPGPVYQRLRAQGRLFPAGLTYVESWVDEDLSRCFQLMATEDRALLERWIERWADLVDFEIVPVIDSSEAQRRMRAPRGGPPERPR